jgi:Bacterial Ig-like domain (group 3)/FG-GAP-like repeat
LADLFEGDQTVIEVPFLRRSRLAKASFRAGLGLWLRPSLLLLCGWARLSAMLAVVAVLGVPLAEAAATTTTLALSASSVASGTVVTFTATVRNPALVTAGTVTFCNAAAPYCEDSAIIGTAQLTSAGTAIIRLAPGIGPHSYKAVFTATTTNGASNSSASPQALVVTGLYPTATTIVASGTSAGSNYTLTSNVVGTGSIAFSPTPTVSFLDTSNGNASLGTATLGGSTFAQTFAPQLTSATLGDSNDVAVGDFNQDGLLDVVVLNYYASSLSVFLGAGDGTFGTPTQFPADFTCYSVVVGDFNGDGKLDLAVTNINAWTVSIYLGNGDGTFQSKQDYPVGGRPQGLVVGDFNRDGNLDLAVANTSSASVSILLGDGLGGFAAQVTYPVGNSPTSVAVADFNGDGFPDLAVTNYSDGTQLDATPSVPGTPVYTPAAGTIQATGTDTLSVTYTPTDTTDYNNFSGSVQLTVGKATPTVSWATPAAITFGTVLSATQLDATPSVPGTPVYTPLAGTTPATGTDTLSVTYTPTDTTDYNTFSGSVNLTVNKATTTVGLIPSLNPSLSGSSVTFTASVVSTSGTATGSVTFEDGGATIGTPLLNGSGVATVSTSSLIPGSHSITAVYGGDANDTANSSPVLVQVVQASTNTLLTSSLNPSSPGATVIFTAAVTSSAGTPGGSVTFLDGTTTLGTGTLNGAGVATYSTSSLAPGPHSITASYGAAGNYLASTSPALTQSVQQGVGVLLTSSGSPSQPGSSVIFTAAVAGGSITPTGSVTFMNGAAVLGPGTLNGSGVATFSTSSLGLGVHSITAVYGGDPNNAAASSNTFVQSVEQVTNTALSSNSAFVLTGANVIFTAAVTGGSAIPTGSVTFLDGSTPIDTGTLDGTGTATFSTASLSMGAHSITAVYAGDANSQPSTSLIYTQTVQETTTRLSSRASIRHSREQL